MLMNEIKAALKKAISHLKKDEDTVAHEIVMSIKHPLAYRIHAHLHRKEGDHANAQYWYDKAALPVSHHLLSAELEEILLAVDELVADE